VETVTESKDKNYHERENYER